MEEEEGWVVGGGCGVGLFSFSSPDTSIAVGQNEKDRRPLAGAVVEPDVVRELGVCEALFWGRGGCGGNRCVDPGVTRATAGTTFGKAEGATSCLFFFSEG